VLCVAKLWRRLREWRGGHGQMLRMHLRHLCRSHRLGGHSALLLVVLRGKEAPSLCEALLGRAGEHRVVHQERRAHALHPWVCSRDLALSSSLLPSYSQGLISPFSLLSQRSARG
jgi:hypothetical protein